MRQRLEAAIAPLVDEARREGLLPGAAVGVAVAGKVVLMEGFGRVAYPDWAPPVTEDTIYDLASLTKPLATALLTALAAVEGRLAMEAPVGDLVPGLPEGVAPLRVEELLDHRSGLPPWAPLYRELEGVAPEGRPGAVLRFIGGLERTGNGYCYSDLGFVVLGLCLERIYGVSLPRLFQERLAWSPLSLGPVEPGNGVAPAEWCPVRDRVVMGEVHDLNAWFLGGAAGHAGLFGSVRGVMEHLFALRVAAQGRGDGMLVEAVDALRSSPRSHGLLLGFQRPGPGPSTAGTLFPEEGVGHLGFTGCSFWWALEQDVMIVVLSNRTFPVAPDNPCRHGHRPLPGHPVRRAMFRFRAALHDAIMEVVNRGR